MQKRALLALVLVGLLAIPMGFALANERVQQDAGHFWEQAADAIGLEQAASEMGLELAEAREILAQARELNMRSFAHRQGISYEEALERMEQRRQEISERGRARGARMRLRDPEGCGMWPRDEQ